MSRKRAECGRLMDETEGSERLDDGGSWKCGRSSTTLCKCAATNAVQRRAERKRGEGGMKGR